MTAPQCCHLDDFAKAMADETRQRILETMRDMGYVANPAARTLRGDSKVIGLVVPDLTSPYMGEVISGISRATTGRAELPTTAAGQSWIAQPTTLALTTCTTCFTCWARPPIPARNRTR